MLTDASETDGEMECEEGETRPCGEDAGDPICSRPDIDAMNCGRCGNQCPQGARCTEGRCGACEVDWWPADPCNGDCVVCEDVADESMFDRICTTLEYDNFNCGRCENRCAEGENCENGRCMN